MIKEKGITLIALVITIIVLLILAGVSIALLTGDNGILTKANTASKETKLQGAKEKVQIAVASSYGKKGIEYSNLKYNLNKIDGINELIQDDIDEMSFPLVIKVDDNNFVIEKNGNVNLASEENMKPKEKIFISFQIGNENGIEVHLNSLEGTKINNGDILGFNKGDNINIVFKVVQTTIMYKVKISNDNTTYYNDTVTSESGEKSVELQNVQFNTDAIISFLGHSGGSIN